MPDPRLARLRAAVEQKRALATDDDDFDLGFQDACDEVLSLLDAEAGEPELRHVCEELEGFGLGEGDVCPACMAERAAAPPPSDARERFNETTPGPAIFASQADVAALTARVAELEQTRCAVCGYHLGSGYHRTECGNGPHETRAAPSGDADNGQLPNGKRGVSNGGGWPSGDAAQGRTVGSTCLHPIDGGGLCLKPLGHEGPCNPVPAPTPEPAPAWPSEAAMQSYLHTLIPAFSKDPPYFPLHRQHDAALRAAYAVDLPQIERAAEERGARAFVEWANDAPYLVEWVEGWLAQRAEGSP